VTLGACAETTARARLGVGVTNPITRHPLVTACAILSLDDVSAGRAVLGIGSGDSAMRTLGLDAADARGTHGSRRDRLRETVELVRAVCAGEAVRLGPSTFQLERPGRRIPIYIAATGPRMLELAGQIADGVIMQVGIHPACVEQAIGHIRKGAARAGRDPNAIDVVCSTFTSIADDRALAIDRARPLAAWFYAVAPELLELASVPVGQRHPARPVLPDISHPADHDQAMAEARRYVSDEAVEKFCLVGPAPECVGRIRQLATLGVHQIFFRHYLTYDLPLELIEAAGRAIIPRFR
jgi:5,10-methylenetetrahydromethanopterin reductase